MGQQQSSRQNRGRGQNTRRAASSGRVGETENIQLSSSRAEDYVVFSPGGRQRRRSGPDRGRTVTFVAPVTEIGSSPRVSRSSLDSEGNSENRSLESEEERKPLDIRFREYFRALRQAYKTSKKVSTLVIFQLFLAWKLRVRRAC